MIKYLCICGSGRSGSTLLNLLLGSHPQIVSLGETTNLARSVRENRKCTCGEPVKACAFWGAVRSKIAREHGVDIFEQPADFPVALKSAERAPAELLMHYQRQALAALGRPALARAEFVPAGRTPTRAVVRNIFRLYDAVRETTGCRLVVDSSKLPLRMKWLWMERPDELRAIYLVRDGRAVVASSIRHGGLPTQTAVWNWIRTQLTAQLMCRSMPKTARLLVRYEDLCRDPERELKRICGFLSLEFSPDMLDFRKAGHHDLEGNRMRFGTSSTIENRETWRQELNQDDLRIFERRAGSLNRRLGYHT